MNSQDFRNLQEAYLDVYYELDEGRGDDLRTKYGLKPGEVSTKLSKRAEVKELNIGRRTHFDRERSDSLLRLSGLSKERSQGETPAGNSRWNSEGQLRDIRSRGGRPSNRYDAGAGRDRGNKEQRLADWASGKRDHPNMTDSERRFVHHNRYADPYAVRNEQVDLYDLILSHLLDEGAAEDVAARARKLARKKGQTPEKQKIYQDLANKAGKRADPTQTVGFSRFEYNQRHGRPLITPQVSQSRSSRVTLGGGTYRSGSERLPKSQRKHDIQVLSGVRAASEQEKERARRRMGIVENYDLYDIILSHLLDEGYADTQEAAESIMVNMSEDWRESICEV